MTTNPRSRRLRGVLALLAASAVGVVGLAMPASAADNVSLIPADAIGSITVTKYSTPDNERPTEEGNGKPWTPPVGSGSVPLPGATFQVFKLDDTKLTDKIDLRTNPGWQNLEKLIAKVGKHATQAEIASKEPNLTLDPKGTQTTPASGVVTFDNLPVGAYYVVETGVPEGHKASEPFFVTIPMTDPTDLSTWMYNIYVYPKNIQDNTSKVPLDIEKHVVGDEIVWEIRTKIPDNATDVTVMKTTDTLSEVLDFVAADSTNVQMQIGTDWQEPLAGNPTLTRGLDFDVSTIATAGPLANQTKVTAALGTGGLAKVNANKGKTLLTHIKTKVNSKFAGYGEVKNEASVIVNKPGSNIEEEVVPPEAISKYGKVRVNKVNAANDPLTGAKFDVYYSHIANPDFSKNNPTEGYVKTDAVCDMTGKTFCEFSVRLSDWASNKKVNPGDPEYNYYFLKETLAPTDYELLVQPWKFVVEQADVDDNFIKKLTIDVVNVKRGGGLELPFTGGAGTIMFLVIGAALLAGATAMTVIRSRQRKSEV